MASNGKMNVCCLQAQSRCMCLPFTLAITATATARLLCLVTRPLPWRVVLRCAALR